MQETVTNTSERKSLFSSFLEVLEAREKQAQVDRQLQEEKYLRRTQKIYDFHERQRREAVELRRCLDYVSQHAHVLESVLRGAGAGAGGAGAGGAGAGEAPLSAGLARQAGALQRCMAQCVANAARIRQLLTATHQPQMDTMLAKMEAELSTWTAFLHRAVDATYNTEVVIDNLQNMIAEQHRCVREVSSSSVFTSLCGASGEAAAADAEVEAAAGAGAEAEAEADAEAGAASGAAAGAGAGGEAAPQSPLDRRAPSLACSTPIARD